MPAPSDERVGTTLRSYRIEALLGRGGMGMVYLAQQEGLERKVALKILSPDLAHDEGFRQRFIQESRTAASLDHPNVVPIYESGEADGVLFIAMRYVRGTDLKALLAEAGPLPPDRAVSICSQVAAALDAAHTQGLVHRDVKPANVLLVQSDQPDQVYLSDFGLTKRSQAESGLTASGVFVGTLAYAAPEQFEGKALDSRADEYALGCVLYECLTGEPPFKRDRDAAVMYAHLTEAPPDVRTAQPDLPEALNGVVARALAKRPEDRYQTAGELAKATKMALAGTLVETATPRARRRLTLVAAAVVAVLVAVGVVAERAGGGHAHGSASSGSPAITTSSQGPTPSSTTSAITFTQGLAAIDARTHRVKLAIPGPGVANIRSSTVGVIAVGEGAVWTAEASTLVRVEASTGEERSIPVGFFVGDIALGQGAVWATAELTGGSGDQIVRIDPATGEVLAQLRLFGSALVVVGRGVVWEADPNGYLAPIDPGSDHAGRSIKVASDIAGVAYGAGSLWVIDSLAGEILRLDGRSGAHLASYHVPGDLKALTVGFGGVWVLDSTGGSVTRLDVETGHLSDPIRVGSAPTDLVAGLGSVWVANRGDESISRIDPATQAQESFDVGAPVSAIAVDPETHRLWTVISPTENE